MYGWAKRHAKLAIGWKLLIAGLIIAPMPIPVGQVIALTGLSILVHESELVRRWVRGLRSRYPRGNTMLNDFKARLPGFLRRVIERTDPHCEDVKGAAAAQAIAALSPSSADSQVMVGGSPAAVPVGQPSGRKQVPAALKRAAHAAKERATNAAHTAREHASHAAQVARAATERAKECAKEGAPVVLAPKPAPIRVPR